MRRGLLLPLAAILIAAGPGSAPAAAATRAEFATQADAICKAQVHSQLKSAKKRSRRLRGKGNSNLRFFRRNAMIEFAYGRAVLRSRPLLAALVPAPGDETMVSQWLDSLAFDAKNAFAVGRIGSRGRIRFGRYFKAIDVQTAHSQATDLLVDGLGMKLCASDTHLSTAVHAGGFG